MLSEKKPMSKCAQPNEPGAIAPRLAHSIADAAKIAGVGRSFLYEEINAGRLKLRKAGRRSLIFETDLKAWLESLPAKNAESSKLDLNTP
jgi:excisionase family DNA binding protein